MKLLKQRTAACAALALLVFGAPLAKAADKNIVETAVAAGSFKTLAAALQAADLVDALQGEGPFTVFAPTDEAFAKVPKETLAALLKPENKQQLVGVLTYHVVKGKVPASKVVELTGAKTLNGQLADIKVKEGKVYVDKAQVVKTDIETSNGIIHVIDSVILPASDDLVTTAVKAGDFSTLVAAAKAAGLVEALSGSDPVTVFAPTDDAFAKLPEGTVATLLKPENKSKLVDILKYHVVAGRVYSMDAVKAGKAETLQGGTISITAGEGGAKVNDAKLIATDIDASNGVIHVIDSVILPPDDAKTSAVDPREQIRSAINTGAPLYNAGHHGECAQVYMTTINQMVDGGHASMCPTTVAVMKTALQKAQHTSCTTSQAWILRQALDTAYENMTAAR